jgi:hypothetical protein
LIYAAECDDLVTDNDKNIDEQANQKAVHLVEHFDHLSYIFLV